ncbi:MAG: DUF4199 family protein [Ignavibacteria bacterium]|nr:DUF4199 family protein [Ignavibacteria bacterium]
MVNSKYFPTLVSGFAAGVLSTVPILKSTACCILVPAAVIFALYADRRINNDKFPLQMSYALVFGLLTGVFTAFFGTTFDVLISFITRHNEFVDSYPQILQMLNEMPFLQGSDPSVKEAMDILEATRDDLVNTGFSGFYAVMSFINNLIFYPLFGLLGGLLGKAILDRSNKSF